MSRICTYSFSKLLSFHEYQISCANTLQINPFKSSWINEAHWFKVSKTWQTSYLSSENKWYFLSKANMTKLLMVLNNWENKCKQIVILKKRNIALNCAQALWTSFCCFYPFPVSWGINIRVHTVCIRLYNPFVTFMIGKRNELSTEKVQYFHV